jgi:hypothetical protein
MLYGRYITEEQLRFSAAVYKWLFDGYMSKKYCGTGMPVKTV